VAGRGRPKGTKNRPKYIIESEKIEKEQFKSERIGPDGKMRRGRKPGTKNRPKEVILAEKEENERLKREKLNNKHKCAEANGVPYVIPVNTIFVLKSEVKLRGYKNARRFVATDTSECLIEYCTENGKSHVTTPENIIVCNGEQDNRD